jgi:hypothetical protein
MTLTVIAQAPVAGEVNEQAHVSPESLPASTGGMFDTPFDNTNSGYLSANNNRTKESHPNARGRVNAGGLWYWLSGWNKLKAGTNDKFVSLSLTLMTQAEVDQYVNNIAPVEAPPVVAPVAQ